MQVQRLLAVPLYQAVRAVPLVEAEQAGGVDQQYRLAQQAGGVQRLHAEQTLDHLGAQAFPAGEFHVVEEVIERVMDRQRRLLRPGQAIEVGQDVGATVAEFIIELAAGAQLQQVQRQPPPDQETAGVDARLGHARIGQTIEPVAQLREEVADGLDQGAAGDQGRPALRRRCRAWVCTRARLS